MKQKIITLLVSLIVNLGMMQAVTHYSCDFESETARARWTLNPAANQAYYNQLVNKWYLGEPGNHDRNGQYGLYISDDGGATAHYTNRGCWVFAYDTISLDHIAGDYWLTFDYTVASYFDRLYALWIPMTNDEGDSIKVNSLINSTGQVPTRYSDYVIRLQPTANVDYLNRTAMWRQCAVKIPGLVCDGTPHYLAFAWANGSNTAQQPGAMIDNILITRNVPCNQPTNLVVNTIGSSVSLEWEGTATEYEVSAYSYDGQSWAGPKIVTGHQTTFSGLPIGQTDFIVRAKCGDDSYSLKTSVSKLIYYPDQMCVDYLNLNNAVCYVDNSSPMNTLTFDDFKVVAPVDLGPTSSSSRHTIHFDRSEYEPRTGGMAKTIPEGEFASIRLGNWEADNHAERIEFTFDVDTFRFPVLLLKYMPILEAPGHDDPENPRFKIDILINGQSLGGCAQLDINADDVMNGSTLKPDAIQQGWHITPAATAQTSGDIVWKEWTTVGINLKKPEYQGKRLTIRLTTLDCAFSAHCGYAYFTLGCSDGKLRDMKCGEINPEFEAPDGFDYRWAYAYNERYRRLDGSLPEQYVLHRGQIYNAGVHDDSLYVVDCMFAQDSTCFFSLYATSKVTEAVAQMNEPQIMKNVQDGTCTVTFDASPSWVREIDHLTGDTSVSKAYHIETYEWIVDGLLHGWSDEVSPTFTIPSTEGVYNVYLHVRSAFCESTLHYRLYLGGASINVVTDSTQGTVEVLQEEYNKVVLTATPKYGYHFAQWGDGNTENPRVVELTRDTTFVAEFAVDRTGTCGNDWRLTWTYDTIFKTLSIMGNGAFVDNIQCGVEARAIVERIIIGEGITAVNDTAFTNCSNLKFVVWKSQNCADLASCPFPNSVESVILDDGVVHVPSHLCDGLSNISSIIIPSSVQTIGDYAFANINNRKINNLVLPSQIISIGNYAFAGNTYIEKIDFGQKLESIGEYAFQSCSRVATMTCLAEITPDVGNSALNSISSYAELYVLSSAIQKYRVDSNWSRFLLKELGATETTATEGVIVTPGDNSVTLTWPTDADAASYTIVITKDGTVFCTLIFNAAGQLIGITFAPSRDGGTHSPSALLTSNGMQFTVTGLNAATNYAYSITAKAEEGDVIASYSGTFDTSGAPQGMDELNANSQAIKLLLNGQILILRGDKIYTITGQEIK